MPADPSRVQAVFMLAVETADAAARLAILEAECAGDAELRQRVEALLNAHDREGDFLGPAHDAGSNTGTLASIAPVIDNRYRLVQLLGEGGMGEVWLAEQREPVRRSVAVKLIKPGMNSKAVLARFDAERQALALMDHPNIAKVLDAGTSESGRPYFVMELVRGIPLTEYCDSRQLNVEQRLELFRQICQAVQHAHQKGVIHRDLKPTNVLIAEIDGKPAPKIIDFGLAKALGESEWLTGGSMHTAIGAVIGTPLYMAPEQVGVNLLDVDTRADVYALGVILYELLTGTTPVEKQRLQKAAWDEVRRVIREEEPPKPSTRLSSSDALPSIAAQRDVEPAQLNRLVRGDLDWIVMKALEKDRNRRYETAQSLAQDVQRYLSGDAVEAGPPSRTYKLRKFAQRNRGALLMVGIVLVAMVTGLIGTTLGLIRAEHARAAEANARVEAEAARIRESERADSEAKAVKEAATQRDRAMVAEKQAKLEANTATAIQQFMRDDVLQAANPLGKSEVDPDLTMRAVLRRAAAAIEGRFPNQPLVEASLRRTIGNALVGIGAYDDALSQLRRALDLLHDQKGSDDADSLSAMNDLSRAYWHAGAPRDAISHAHLSFDQHQNKYGPDARQTLEAQLSLGMIYLEKGEPGNAIPILEDCRRRSTRELGANDELPMRASINLGAAHVASGDWTKAATILDECRKASAAAFGPGHYTTLTAEHSLALVDLSMDRLGEAIDLAQDCFERRLKRFGADHPETLACQHALATAHLAKGQLDLAIPLLEQCLEYRKAKHTLQSPITGAVFRDLAWAYLDAKQPQKAVELSRQFVEALRRRKPVYYGELAGALMPLGQALTAIGKPAEAEPILRECLSLREKYQPVSWPMATAQAALGATLLELKNRAEAETLLLAGFAGIRDRNPSYPPALRRKRLLDVGARLIRLYRETNQPEKAASWKQKVEMLDSATKR